MSDQATPRLNLPYLAASQAQKHVTLNEALGLLDSLVSASVVSRTTAAEPSSPPDGATYVLPPSATGAEWALHAAGSLLRFESGAWTPVQRAAGQVLYVADEGALILFDGSAFVPLGDALGRRAKLNKPNTGDTCSLHFQKAFSSRAEIGLVGDDRFALKVSADGSSFTEALKVESGGQVRLPAKPLALAYRTAGAVTVGASLAALVCDGESLDATGDYNPATGTFTCPAVGRYRVAANILLDSGNAAGVLVVGYLLRNGVAVGGPLLYAQQIAAGAYQNVPFETVLTCVAGDQLQLALVRGGAANVTVFGGGYTRVSFEFVG